MKQTITAVIPALNEEKNIERCINSVLWCDKIMVMWMGNDKTGDIAKKMGAEVIKMNTSDKDDFIKVQKNINYAIDQCKTDWMLRIDADEVVTDELKNEIISTLSNSPIAYGIPRAQYFWNGFLKGGDWAYDRLVRLFKPKFCRYDPIVAVHEQFKVNGHIGYLQNKLLHYSHPTLKDARNKFQKYTDVEIQDLHISKFEAALKMCTLPFYIFLRWIIWHQGYRDGVRGLVAGIYRGWYEYLLYSKYLLKKSN
ncbi:MAG: glycosyltransferase family 2 protein [bacterium]|nr:glycosyltransferase family 2 protein [bacterium]